MNFKALKMDGLGNDFLIIDKRKFDINLAQDQIKKLSDRNMGIGFDQLISIEKSNSANAEIKYFNSDGKFANACGNGNRCVTDILLKETGNSVVKFKVGSFLHEGKKISDKMIQVSMPQPVQSLEKIPVTNEVKENPVKIKILEDEYLGHLVNVGNPHIVIFEKISVEKIKNVGPMIEKFKYFPDRVNVTFADIKDNENISVNVWERGAGKTLACGTAACATAFIAITKGLTKNPTKIHFDQGYLDIGIKEDKTLVMTGPISDQKEIEVQI